MIERSSTNDQLFLVQGLKKRGLVVAATGDGTNDAPVYTRFDCYSFSFFLSCLNCYMLQRKFALQFFFWMNFLGNLDSLSMKCLIKCIWMFGYCI